MKKYNWQQISCFLVLLVMSSCAGVPRSVRKSGNIFLKKNEIQIVSQHSLEEKRALAYDLDRFAQPKPNSKWAKVLPTRMLLYERAQHSRKVSNGIDTSRINRWILNKYGEKPAILDSVRARKSATSMENALKNKGYFDAKVTFVEDINLKRKSGKIKYIADARRLYTIDTVEYETTDDRIRWILSLSDKDSELRRGAPVSNTLFEIERTRIVRELRNNGYLRFAPSYIEYEGDSTANKGVKVKLKILSPPDSTHHTAYNVDKINVYTRNIFPEQYDSLRTNTDIDGVRYIDYQLDVYNTPLRYNLLKNAILLTIGETYRQEDYEQTVKRLRALGIYKFVDVRMITEPKTNKAVANIYLTPANRREVGWNTELNTAVAQNRGASLGLSGGVFYNQKNLFRRAVLFTSSVEGGIELGAFADNKTEAINLLGAINFKTEFGLNFPRLIVPFALPKSVTRQNARTRLALLYSYQQQIQLFESRTIGASWGYTWNQSATKSHSFQPISMSAIRYSVVLPNRFLSSLIREELQNSQNYVFVGSNYSFSYTSKPTYRGKSFFFKTNLESMGNMLWLVQRFRPESQRSEIIGQPYAQYFKAEFDGRYYKQMKKANFVARANIGAAVPYGASGENGTPFSKQFSLGGPNSMRAWQIRRLGPGDYFVPDNIADTLLAYQSGDLKIELNAEYRFPIFENFKGALFVDVGNVWNIKNGFFTKISSLVREQTDYEYPTNFEGENRTLTTFSPLFYKRLAVGTGFGLRLDFSYFILRLDVGYKLRYPYPIHGRSGWVNLDGASIRGLWQNGNLNLGVGYPF